MAGLLSDVLPAVYSAGNRAKRYVKGLLSDPMGEMELVSGGILDAARAHEQTMNQAFANPQRPLQITDPNALAQATQNMMAGPLGFAPAGITAWHGSPHKFDKFDSTKIGTGEGAQAYGHGLYMAESPEVARTYGKSTTPGNRAFNSVKYNGQDFPAGSRDGELLYDVTTKGRAAVIQNLQKQADRLATINPKESANLLSRIEYVKTIKPDNVQIDAGNLYKADIPDEAVARMLDWDKPLSQQPKNVQDFFAANGFDLGNAMTSEQLHSAAKKYLGSKQAIKMASEDIYFARDLSAARKAWNKGAADLEDYMSTGDGSWLRGVLTGAKDGNKSGGAAYRQLADKLGGFGQANYQGGGQVAASDALRTGGASHLGMSDGLRGFPSGGTKSTIAQIPGIRYLDGGSRGTGSGTSNFVVFPGNEGLLTILERNGQKLR